MKPPGSEKGKEAGKDGRKALLAQASKRGASFFFLLVLSFPPPSLFVSPSRLFTRKSNFSSSSSSEKKKGDGEGKGPSESWGQQREEGEWNDFRSLWAQLEVEEAEEEGQGKGRGAFPSHRLLRPGKKKKKKKKGKSGRWNYRK